MENIADQFNYSVKFLARVYLSKKKGTFDEEIAMRNIQRLKMLTRSEPMFLIQTCGPYFLKYADIIERRDWDALLSTNFNDDLAECDGDTRSALEKNIKFIKSVIQTSKDSELSTIGDHVQSLLKFYCQFQLLQ